MSEIVNKTKTKTNTKDILEIVNERGDGGIAEIQRENLSQAQPRRLY